MDYLICIVPVMPLRAEPSDRSEMVSQLLFGEAATFLEQGKKGWVRLRNQFDQYEGWASLNQMHPIDERVYNEPTIKYTGELMTTVVAGGRPMHVPIGSFLKGIRYDTMKWKPLKIIFKGTPIVPGEAEITEKNIKDLALKFLNAPYLWGGRSNFGIDCSGFSQSVWRLLGKKLPRDAGKQASCGKLIEDNTYQCGDLAFFHNEHEKITHVGLLLNKVEIIHASGKVRIDTLDDTGIKHGETGEYTHTLSMVRRLV